VQKVRNGRDHGIEERKRIPDAARLWGFSVLFGLFPGSLKLAKPATGDCQFLFREKKIILSASHLLAILQITC
jgi:hypothetical protein